MKRLAVAEEVRDGDEVFRSIRCEFCTFNNVFVCNQLTEVQLSLLFMCGAVQVYLGRHSLIQGRWKLYLPTNRKVKSMCSF